MRKILSLVCLLLSAIAVNATDTNATLLTTWSVQGGSNTSGVFYDAETHYYNNWGTGTGWYAQAYAMFDISGIPAGENITSATFTVYANCGGTKTRNFDVNYLPLDADTANYKVLVSNTGTKLASFTDITATYTAKEVNATEAIKAAREAGKSTIVFIMSNGAAGGNIYGKGSAEFAPTLSITSTAAALVSAGAITVKYVDDSNNELGSQNVSVEGKYVGDEVTTSFPLFINNNGKYYKMTGTEFSKTIATTKDAQEIKVSYAEDTEGVVAFAEVEDLTPNIGATANTACSNGKYSAINGGKTATIGTFAAGKYKVCAYLVERGERGIYIRDAGNTNNSTNEIINAGTSKTSAAGLYTTDEFSLAKETTLSLSGWTTNKASTNQSAGLDYVYIIKTGDYTPENPTRETAIGKFGTICLPYAANVTGAKVYAASLNDTEDVLTLTEVGSSMEAGVPYIYQATEETQSFTLEGEAVVSPEQAYPLIGVFEDTQITSGYVLQTQGDVQQFYTVNSTTPITVPANKAYIYVNTPQAKAISLRFADDDATAINALNALVSDSAKIYDINGRQLKSLQKGVNIVNGTKVVVK